MNERPRMAFTYFYKISAPKKRLHLMFAYPNEQQTLDVVKRQLFSFAEINLVLVHLIF